jgi:adiponectin receptor
MFRLHNETWNIWTHFGGFLFFVALVLGMYTFGDYITGLFEDLVITSLPGMEQFMLALFFGGAIMCMLCSTLFHILHNHSHNVSLLFSRLDYSGITFLITGSSIPAYYYGFYCTWVSQCIHIGVLVVLCCVCLVVSMWRKFHTPGYRATRYITFVSFGLYGVIPGVHIYLRDGYTLAADAYALWGILMMAAIYIGGGALYACRIPERFWPGTFDVWASSHQLFHVCVVTASLVHYNALLSMAKYRLDIGSCLDVMPLVV